MNLTQCPVCDEPLISDKLIYGFLFCRNAHVLTLAPFHELDPRVLIEFAIARATIAEARGQQVDQGSVAAWRGRA